MEHNGINGHDCTLQERILKKVNDLRALHDAPPLRFDPHSELTRLAQEKTAEIIQKCQVVHTVTKEYGQNLFIMSTDWNFEVEDGVLFWYNEIDDYDGSRPQWQDGCGHFTQLVWKESEEVGIGVDTGNGHLAITCNFLPKGNVYGQFADNVSKDDNQKSFPIVI